MPQGPVVVVGAGAAGLMAGLFAARAGARVVVVEGTRDGGRKILISGGGRCNVLPSTARPERYVTSSSPHTLRKMLRSWPLAEQRRFFEGDLGLPLALEPDTGKLFPASNRARDVRDRLVGAVGAAGGEFRFGERVTGLGAPPTPGASWRVHLADGRTLAAARVVVAAGGWSVPATGSDGAAWGWAESLGHVVHEPYPALTPLTGAPAHAALAGVSLDVVLRAPGARPRFETAGGFLFTHRGYSGPTVLDASHLAILSRRRGERQRLTVQWTDLDGPGWDGLLQEAGAGQVGTVVGARIPTRLARVLLDEAGVPWDRAASRLRRDERKRLVAALAEYDLPWTGDEGYRKAEVTGGGVALDQVDPGTLESRIAPGLHLCGEILDAFGPIGGHNFLWAWATGRAAGIAAGEAASGSGAGDGPPA